MEKKTTKRICLSLILSFALMVLGIAVSDGKCEETAVAASNVKIEYTTHVQTYGWMSYVANGATSGTTGQSKRVEALKIKLTNANYSGGIQYRTYVQSYGWRNWTSNNAINGTSGEAKRMEAFQVKLTGEMANKYDVYYRAYAQIFGWLGWAKNGQTAGTAEYGYRLEAIQIKLVAKGAAAPGSTAGAYRHPMVKYKTHVQTYGWQDWFKDGETSGTVGQAKRLEAIQISLPAKEYTGGIEYRTHVQTYGWLSWVSNGSISGTSGQAKRLEAIEIKLTGEMANKYDIYYRVHAQKFGWLGWAKNGASAGTAGYGYRLEGIQIKLVAKGGAAPGPTTNCFKSNTPVNTVVNATGITLNKTTLSLNKGTSQTLTATVLPSNATNKTVTWSSSNSVVATVTSAGKITAVKDGTATITAKTSNGKTATCKVTVVDSSVSEPSDTPQGNQEDIYNKLFDINNKVKIKLDITDAQLKLMQSDYKAGNDTYRKANMTVTIGTTTYKMYEVGVRIKGNTSRVNIYNNGNLNDRNMIHFKVTFKETFDGEEYGTAAKQWATDEARKARKKRTFATMKGMELKWNRNLDSTYVANVYVNQMYRALGVAAQNTSLANVEFGGYNYGVYTIYENVDETFVERYFGDADANDLYKCAWGQKSFGSGGGWSGATYKKDTLNSIEVEELGKDYIYELKTNKKKSDKSLLKNLINTLDTSSVSKTTFSNVVDSGKFVNFAAVSYFAGNPDDLRNNYNNHYVYFMSNGKAVFIPYDYDRCLGMTTGGKNMATYSPFDDRAILANETQANPVFRFSVTGRNNSFTTEYKAALKKVYDSGWLNYSKYLTYYNAAKKNYSTVAIPDSHIKLYVSNLNESPVTYKNSELAFAESNNRNTSVKDYLNTIKATYETAISK